MLCAAVPPASRGVDSCQAMAYKHTLCFMLQPLSILFWTGKEVKDQSSGGWM